MELDSPESWRPKGQGNANWVFSYTGSLPHLVGQVLRVRKPRPTAQPEQLALEEAVWAPVLGAAAGRDAACRAAAREQAYIGEVLAPLLGRQHVPRQQPVLPTPGFVERLLLRTGCTSSQAEAAAAAALGVAALLPDATLLRDGPGSAPGGGAPAAAGSRLACGAATAGPTVCVELKPKCGFVGGDCGTVHPSNRAIKRSRSRFQLHQLLKLEQGKVSAVSGYDPCDLFSGSPARLRAALAALLEEPQNNLLLFLDGVKHQLPGQRQACGSRPHQQASGEQPAQQQQQPPLVEELLAGLLPLLASKRRAALVELVAAVLEREGVLPRLLAAQQQCQVDVEGVYRLYCHLAGIQPTAAASRDAALQAAGSRSIAAATRPAADDGHATAVHQLLALPLGEAYAVLRAYVVAATAKDCAIMVALQRLAAAPGTGTAPAGPLQQGQAGKDAALAMRRVWCGAAGAWYSYRLSFVDLDQKPLAKITKHHELDAAILAAARRHTGTAPGAAAGGGSAAVGACVMD